ncbi:MULTISPECIES: vancomycin high temperature exclusion protein [unclassified Neisseria]|uniref:SanA/YdcF family protein n=1 Tax=unclassified Neisseria TaxID=2623750 RepID=UPI00266682FD|nr:MULTISPECIES: ElyC/SanA/YdcF family protein [unclassified Neisseria]MDO1510553.1 ElyC/SanA/YdcF family protein [Neisseria sp. MVDL19-042950]MDO1516346.1 ElyC/SanA/YdcF family protein [Neisseria sp. MVDL18-041461]MDO1564108.1 ElyC/SanA/YdcF family protein [Neisseria sp. MVDL20-010259]
MPFGLFILVAADVYITFAARKRSYRRVDEIPQADFGLVLDTAKYVENTRMLNRYYHYRIEAAVELWRRGKVKAFIVRGSGINHCPSETVCMQNDLCAAGVPETVIWQDTAGLRTLDSIIRCAGRFPESSFCIVSQPFHNQRALVQAKACGIEAWAYNAGMVGMKTGWKTHARERAARLRLWYDLVMKTAPIYSLEAVPIAKAANRKGFQTA